MTRSVLDHVGFFAPDADDAERTLQRLGFTVTPFTVQRNLIDGELVPAGTGNRLVVLESGYLEILSPTGEDTPLARQFHAATERYEGVHLITFSEDDMAVSHGRLVAAGFDPAPVVDLTREVETEAGPATARFEVLRIPAGQMAEGRVQICRHHTPELVWQPRWLSHPNGALGLVDVTVVVADPGEAAARYAAFVGSSQWQGPALAWHVPLDIGRLTFVDVTTPVAIIEDLPVPTVPYIAAISLTTRDLAGTRRVLDANEVATSEPVDGVVLVEPTDALGCAIAFGAPS